MKIGFVGLGFMGSPMAGHLAEAAKGSGDELIVWNRTPAKAKSAVEKGAELSSSIEQLASECEVIVTCVNRTEDVKEVIFQMMKSAKPNTLFVDHSTIAPKGAVEIGEALNVNSMRFVDAPVTGGSAGAIAGKLTIFMGGAELDVNEAIKITKPYTKVSDRVGGQGMGQTMKLANQIAGAGCLIALCECLAFAQKSGLDMAQARQLISGGAAGSWAMENYGPKILARDWTPGFSILNQRKDFAYCAEVAEEIQASIPCTMLVYELLGQLESDGRGEQATTALFDKISQT